MLEGWKRGQQAALANKVGKSKQYINGLLHRRTSCPAKLAADLAKACKDMGINISRLDWLDNLETDNPLFSDK